jgi:hypothetical protein
LPGEQGPQRHHHHFGCRTGVADNRCCREEDGSYLPGSTGFALADNEIFSTGEHGDVVGKHGDVVGKHGDVVGKHGDVVGKLGAIRKPWAIQGSTRRR